METRTTVAAFLVLLIAATGALADDRSDDEQLNDLYRQFFTSEIDVSAIAETYREDIIHVGRQGTPLVVGKPNFIETNIEPFAGMINSGELGFEGTAYILRRIISGDMANDVGYLHSSVTLPDGTFAEQVQKFSWVFVKEDGEWKVVTDFDATVAPIEVLEDLEAQIVVN